MAADGMIPDDSSAKGSRFAYASVLQLTGRVGAYDDSARDEDFGLAPFRGQTFAFSASIVADGTNWLQIAALSSPLLLMTQGTGASGTPAGLSGTQTDAESSAGPQGGIVRNEATFVTVGLMLERMDPWVVAAASTDDLANRDDDDFLNGNSIRYGERLQAQVEQAADFLMDVTGGTRKQIQEHLGPPSDWRVSPAGLNLPGHFWMFSSEYGSGGQSSNMQLKVTVNMPRRIRVEENAANPFKAARRVIVPFRLRQVGYTLCGDPSYIGDSCGTQGPRGKVWPGADMAQVARDAAAQGAREALKAAGVIR